MTFDSYMPSVPRGIRKVSELITQKGRTLILTEEDARKLSWDDIPYGTLKINPETGIMSVKLKAGFILLKTGDVLTDVYIGIDNALYYKKDDAPCLHQDGTPVTKKDIESTSESSWIPSGLKNDGTISIARDTMIVEEIFTIKKVSIDRADGEEGFLYENTEGDLRQGLKKDSFFIFRLEKGEYIKGRNLLEVYIDDILRRDEKSGSLIELSPSSFLIKEDLLVGQEITARYFKVVRIGNPYPRIFMGDNAPESAEEGDLWLTLNEKEEWDSKDLDSEDNSKLKTLDWSRIENKPTSLQGYGIVDKVAYKHHAHTTSDIIDFPTDFRASGGNCDTISGHKVGSEEGDLFVIPKGGMEGFISEHTVDTLGKLKGVHVGGTAPLKAVPLTIWFDTEKRLIRFYDGATWHAFGSVIL